MNEVTLYYNCIIVFVLPEEVKWDAEINDERVKIIRRDSWIKLVPLLAKVPNEGIQVVITSGSLSPNTHREFYYNGQPAGAIYPSTVYVGSVVAIPSGTWVEQSPGFVVRAVPMEPAVTVLTTTQAPGSICVSSQTSGYVAVAKYTLS